MIETNVTNLVRPASAMPQHFERSQIPRYDKAMNRGPAGEQLKKVCFACGRGFCKRKGRVKAEQVVNAPDRFVCKKCADALLVGEANDRLKVIDQ